ncbi:S8/S53 family peptidase [Candidatus Babeliales bacterium]|nr:S8/S53 family peptidase [Candidatus Babeliales bacterium]
MKRIFIFFFVFWTFPTSGLEKKLKILLVDTTISVSNYVASNCCSNCCNQSKSNQNVTILSIREKNETFDQTLSNDLKVVNNHKNKDLFFLFEKSKTHADIMISCINSCANDVEIFLLPVFNRFGFCNKQILLNALESIDLQYFHVVLFAGNILNFDPKHDSLDRQILSYLKKHAFVIVAAGNHGNLNIKKQYQRPFFSYFFFSIGAFDDWDITKKISIFSSYHNRFKPSFVMPSQHNQSIGTSIAAALFAGNLIKVISKLQDPKKIQDWCKRNAQKNFEWKNKVRFGCIDFKRKM